MYYVWTALKLLQLCLSGLYLATCVSIFLKGEICWMKYVEYYKLQNCCRINRKYWQHLKYSHWFPSKKKLTLHILNFSAKYQILSWTFLLFLFTADKPKVVHGRLWLRRVWMRPDLISRLQFSWAIKPKPLCASENVARHVGLKVAKVLIVEAFKVFSVLLLQ